MVSQMVQRLGHILKPTVLNHLPNLRGTLARHRQIADSFGSPQASQREALDYERILYETNGVTWKWVTVTFTYRLISGAITWALVITV